VKSEKFIKCLEFEVEKWKVESDKWLLALVRRSAERRHYGSRRAAEYW
jgi:hypothetical protein